MWGSTILTSTSSPSRNGIASSRISSSGPAMTISKWSIGRPSEPVNRKCLPVSISMRCSTRAPLPVNWLDTRGFICPRNASVLRDALGDVLARHLDEAELGDLGGERLRAVLVERLAQRLQHGVAVARPRHVDEVDDDDAADVAEAQLVDDRLGGLEVRLEDGVLEPRVLALAGERAGVDVDDGQRLGVVDQQVAAARQVHALLEQPLDHGVDAVLLEQRRLRVVV